MLTSRSTRGRNAIEFEPQTIAPQRCLGFDATDDVVPVILIEVLSRFGDKLMQVEEFGGFAGDVVDGKLLGRSILHAKSRLKGNFRAR